MRTHPASFTGNTAFAASEQARSPAGRARSGKSSAPSAVHFMDSSLGTVFDGETQLRRNILLQHAGPGPLLWVGDMKKASMAPTFDANLYGCKYTRDLPLFVSCRPFRAYPPPDCLRLQTQVLLSSKRRCAGVVSGSAASRRGSRRRARTSKVWRCRLNRCSCNRTAVSLPTAHRRWMS